MSEPAEMDEGVGHRDTGATDGAGSESMTSRAYMRLREDIISGALKPGRKLKIEELRRTYDVGTSPIREALSLLTSDHFVERNDQRGFRVSEVSAQEFEELLKTRCWLEERALRESIANGTAAWEERVVLANYRLSRIPRSADSDHFVANKDWEDQHKRFHMTLISECGSSMLLKFCDQLYDQNVRYRQLSGTKAYPERDIAEEHNAICDSVLARDADLAAKLLVSHYRRTSNFLGDDLVN
ncbi:MAG: FCD domain-containing protein [Rhizobiaceae bacterium]|nr:FCD domain-containing protein [Rhizobiaceae bacterium]